MITGSTSFVGSLVRKTLPEALLNSEMPSVTWLIVGFLFSGVMMMLCGTSKGAAATAGAGKAGEPGTTFVRSEAVFGGR